MANDDPYDPGETITKWCHVCTYWTEMWSDLRRCPVCRTEYLPQRSTLDKIMGKLRGEELGG